VAFAHSPKTRANLRRCRGGFDEDEDEDDEEEEEEDAPSFAGFWNLAGKMPALPSKTGFQRGALEACG
jgi:hypothetical protein